MAIALNGIDAECFFDFAGCGELAVWHLGAPIWETSMRSKGRDNSERDRLTHPTITAQ